MRNQLIELSKTMSYGPDFGEAIAEKLGLDSCCVNNLGQGVETAEELIDLVLTDNLVVNYGCECSL